MKKIEISDLCRGIYCEVDGKPIEDMDVLEKNELLAYLFGALENLYNEGGVDLIDIIKLFQYDCDESKDLGHCETCGHWAHLETYFI